MISAQNILAWGETAPWSEFQQVEQDLIISRALINIFSDDMLREELRFRGGTALNKLHFPYPLRYSEDIDLVRTTRGGIRPILSQIRLVLEPWLGKGKFVQSPIAPKLVFKVESEDDSKKFIKLKIEINTREIEAFSPLNSLPFKMTNPWFSGQTTIPTFSHEEMLATKLRALLQRNKGRDLYDLAHALKVFVGLDIDSTIEMFVRYLNLTDKKISRAQAQECMFKKLAKKSLLIDMRPLLSVAQAETFGDEATDRAFRSVFTAFVDNIPGKPWAKTSDTKKMLGILW